MGMYKPFLEFSRHSLAKDIYSWTGAIIVYCWRGKKIPNEKQQRDKFYDLFTQIILYKLSPMWKESCRACTVNVDSSSWLAEPYKLGRRGLLESCGPVSKSDLTDGSYVFCLVHLHCAVPVYLEQCLESHLLQVAGSSAPPVCPLWTQKLCLLLIW